MNYYSYVMNRKPLINQQANIIRYTVVVSLAVIALNYVLHRYSSYGFRYFPNFTLFTSHSPPDQSQTRLFADFLFDPVERYDLDNAKYVWAFAALFVFLLALAIGC